MRRRAFLELSGVGALAALGGVASGCAVSTTLPTPDGGGATGDAGPPPTDAARGDEDAAPATSPDGGTSGSAGPWVLSAFDVILNDPSCSGHDHGFRVTAATHVDDAPIDFEGGSHLVRFRPSELARLERGERLPFATVGPGPGHGHCGSAFRSGAFEPTRMPNGDTCTPMPPPGAEPAMCILRPHG